MKGEGYSVYNCSREIFLLLSYTNCRGKKTTGKTKHVSPLKLKMGLEYSSVLATANPWMMKFKGNSLIDATCG